MTTVIAETDSQETGENRQQAPRGPRAFLAPAQQNVRTSIQPRLNNSLPQLTTSGSANRALVDRREQEEDSRKEAERLQKEYDAEYDEERKREMEREMEESQKMVEQLQMQDIEEDEQIWKEERFRQEQERERSRWQEHERKKLATAPAPALSSRNLSSTPSLETGIKEQLAVWSSRTAVPSSSSVFPPPPPPPLKSRTNSNNFSISPTQGSFTQRPSEEPRTEKQLAVLLDFHERQWTTHLLSDVDLYWDSIPWPMLTPPATPEDITFSAVAAYMQSPLLPQGERVKSLTDRLTKQLRRWHSNYFEVKWMPHIVKSDQERVRKGSMAVVRSLEELLKKSNRPTTTILGQSNSTGENSPISVEGGANRGREVKQEVLKRAENVEKVKQREEEIQRKERELMRKEEEIRQREVEWKRDTTVKEQQLQSREDELKMREDVMKARQAKLETLEAAAREVAIRSVLTDAEYHRHLLQCVGKDAQTILDVFQSLLDSGTFSDRGKLVVAMQRLSAKTELYPLRYVLDGPITLVDDYPVNSGRFADIYKAVFQGKSTCLKVVRAYGNLVEQMAKIYAREAILWGQLRHPNVLPFHGLHFIRSQIAFVAPWAENGNLTDYLAREPSANRVLLCMDTSAGINYLHANGVVHGDLKALNVLVDGSGRACLSDFGLSGIVDETIVRWATQSSAASKGGTTRWQAPELHDPEVSSNHNTKQSDIFAWASTCYEIFTGKSPFFEIPRDRETMVAIMILRGDLPTRPHAEDPSWSERGLTERIWNLLVDCWRTKPSERPDIATVISRLDRERPSRDPRPPPQWETGIAMRFRNAQETITQGKRTSIEDLDPILLRVMNDCRRGMKSEGLL